MCGEKVWADVVYEGDKGSPPRVRGKAILHGQGNRRAGITPACAGKSTNDGYVFCAERDHPRVCGEKVQPWKCAHEKVGSPPRVRGKVYRQIGLEQVARITPACAGKRALC